MEEPKAAERVPVIALVLTHRRPRLAAQVVRALLEEERLDPSQVLLVVNGEGGVEDPRLEEGINVLRLRENLGPAGGLARGLSRAREISHAPWIYVCEDDVGLLELPSPRLTQLIDRLERFERRAPGQSVGAVVTSGWTIDSRTGRTRRHEPDAREEFEDVDYNAWAATLLSRCVLEAGVLPDETLFWWGEDMDFFMRVRAAGFRVLVDAAADRHVRGRPRDHAAHQRPERPGRDDEAWCSYYMARNGVLLCRRHGDARWMLWHLLKSARRFQRGVSAGHRTALARGLLDGFLGRRAKNPAFTREVGEW